MTDNSQLIAVENINALELFTEDGIDPMLKAIEAEVAGFVPDLTTAKGRGEIATTAHQVSRAKVRLDNAGKGLVADWKERAKVVDASRKIAREFLDDLRDRTRAPLTEWEKEKAEADAKKAAWEKREYEMGEAIAEDMIFDREAKLKAREAELEAEENARIEKERIAREEQEAIDRAEREQTLREEREAHEKKEREEREARIKREAAEKADADAKQKIQDAEDQAERDREAREKAEQYLKDAAELAVKEKREAEERLEREKREAEERGKREAEEKAQREADERREDERLERVERDRKAADVEHRRGINTKILTALDKEGIGDRTAKKIVTLIATGTIPHVSINY